MALQLGLRRGLASPALAKGSLGTTSGGLTRRWKSGDVGDVIGIDLGTTNSCVATMVRVLHDRCFVFCSLIIGCGPKIIVANIFIFLCASIGYLVFVFCGYL